MTTDVNELRARQEQLDGRVTRLEDQIGAGFDRIEKLLQREISDLKNEQIKDMREANTRLADDQRRLWDHVGNIELRENRRSGHDVGQTRVLITIGHFISAAFGGFITWLVTWLTGGGGHGHP